MNQTPKTIQISLTRGEPHAIRIAEISAVRFQAVPTGLSRAGGQCHIWVPRKADHYETLADWIFGEPWSVGQASLDFRDYSIPRSDPIHNVSSTAALQEAIFNQIRRSHVVVIPSGMYAAYSRWIQKEIDGAKAYGKPILAVNPWGQERRAGVVLNNADEGVGWNKQPLVNAIWKLYYARNP